MRIKSEDTFGETRMGIGVITDRLQRTSQKERHINSRFLANEGWNAVEDIDRRFFVFDGQLPKIGPEFFAEDFIVYFEPAQRAGDIFGSADFGGDRIGHVFTVTGKDEGGCVEPGPEPLQT